MLLALLNLAKARGSIWLKINKDKSLSILMDSGSKVNRQESPKSYDITTVAYVTRPEFVKNSKGFLMGRYLVLKYPLRELLILI